VNADLTRAALLVLDMQVDFCHPDGAYARGGTDVSGTWPLIPRQAAVVAECKRRRIPVVASQFVVLTGLDGQAMLAPHLAQLRPFLQREGFRLGSPGMAVVPELAAPDYLIEKPRYSAFYNTRLELLLRCLKVEHLILCGIATNGAVEATARDAHLRDLEMTVLADCCGSYDPAAHATAIAGLKRMARVIDSERLFD